MKLPPFLRHFLSDLPYHLKDAWKLVTGPWRAYSLSLAVLALGLALGLGAGALIGPRKPGKPPVEAVEVKAAPPPPAAAAPAEPAPALSPAHPAPPIPSSAKPVMRNVPPPQPLALPNTLGGLAVHPEAGPYIGTAIPQTAIVSPKPADGQPPWYRNAVKVPDPGHRPLVAVVIDDLGLDRKRSFRTIDLMAPLTLAYLPYAGDLPAQTQAARAKGHELLVHVPMEPIGENFDAGREVLEVGLAPQEILRRLRWDLDQFTGYVGANNHMGSKFTSFRDGMAVVLSELKARGLLFLDSRTIGNSAGAEVAREVGLPFVERNVFLDNDPSRAAVLAQLGVLERLALQNGHAIAIGHPHDGTLEALEAWLPTLEAKGLVLVPVSAILLHRRNGNGQARSPAGR